jgi:GT2 family glycosyltransferase
MFCDFDNSRIPVMILNWNGWEDTLTCLRALRELSEVDSVWLVDNGSTVDQSDECMRAYPNLRILRFDQNYGWAGGYNRALRIAASEGYEFAYLLNNDTIPAAGFLEVLRRPILQDHRLAAVGSVIVYADKEWVRFDGRYYARKECHFAPACNDEWRLTYEVNGAGMLVRLSALQSDGYFDERFFCYGEEAEWCQRMSSYGWHIAMAMCSIVYHRSEGSDTNANGLYYRSRNKFLLLHREGNIRAIRRRARLIRGIMGTAYDHWVLQDLVGYHATIAALRDGLFGQFGRREDRLLGLCWLTVAGAYLRLLWLTRRLGIRPSRIRASLERLADLSFKESR